MSATPRRHDVREDSRGRLVSRTAPECYQDRVRSGIEQDVPFAEYAGPWRDTSVMARVERAVAEAVLSHGEALAGSPRRASDMQNLAVDIAAIEEARVEYVLRELVWQMCRRFPALCTEPEPEPESEI